MTLYTAPNDQIAKRNVAILIFIQATIGCMIPVHFLLGGLAGKTIAPSAWMATFPISATIIGGMISAPIITYLSNRYNRPISFSVATLIAVIGALLAALSIQNGWFWGLCAGAVMIGFYMSAQGFFRFAATDMASDEFRPRAITYSILGGLAAAIIAPEIGGRFSVPNMALPYVIVAVMAIVLMGAYFFLQLPQAPRRAKGSGQSDLSQILAHPHVQAAMLISITSYAMMNLMMTSTPLAVEGCGFARTDSASVVRAHVLAMFAPSFVTGHLIKRFGVTTITYTGLVILIISGLVALAGISLANFYIAVILLGIGWNFGFIGGTALLTSLVKEPSTARRLQGLNDTLMWSIVAIGSLSSGVLMNLIGDGARGGWSLVAYALIAFLIVAMALGGWLLRRPAPANLQAAE